MDKYYTYNEKTKQLTPVKRVLRRDGKMLVLGNPADFAKYLDAYPRGGDMPHTVDEGFRAIADGYKLIDGKWVKLWTVEPIVYTVDDYDQAMEDYLREVRSKRGYTTREPDTYLHSSDPRWSQDARDWIAFKDDVMHYALAIINEYKTSGKAPTLEEFKAGFPRITWTYTEAAE